MILDFFATHVNINRIGSVKQTFDFFGIYYWLSCYLFVSDSTSLNYFLWGYFNFGVVLI